MSHRLPVLAGTVVALTLSPAAARAEGIIKNPGDHPHYAFEAEPHLAFDPYGNDGIGPGFRGTFVVLENGFIPSINNSIGVGVGLDWLFYDDHCGPDRSCRHVTDALIPVVMQWNFFLHPRWSVFGEPGIAFHARSGPGDKFNVDPFVIYGGGRFHFNDNVALTLRLGTAARYHSVFSVGVSFFL
jgi:hypothetical protein